jgi:uncharacterized protein (DUF4415 family)
MVKKSSGSSALENRLVRSDEITSEERERKIARSLARLDAMREEDIDLTDMPEVDFSTAQVGKFYRPVKDQVTLRIDRPVLEWFKANHDKYQTAINQVLLKHMRQQRHAELRRKLEEDEARDADVNQS